jgi:Domain of unknown function (DUF4190)
VTGGPDPDPAPGAAPANTMSYIAIVCGILALLVSWLVFGIVGIALGFVARGRRERRWQTGLGAALAGTVLGLLSVLLLS